MGSRPAAKAPALAASACRPIESCSRKVRGIAEAGALSLLCCQCGLRSFGDQPPTLIALDALTAESRVGDENGPAQIDRAIRLANRTLTKVGS